MSRLRRFASWFSGDGAFLRYLLVGASISLLDLALFTTFSLLVGLHEVVSNVCSTIISVCVSYLINRAFVFRADRAGWRSFFSFAGVTLLTGLVLQSLVIWAIVGLAGWIAPALAQGVVLPAAKVCAMGVGALANYLGYRWVFRKRRRSEG